MRTFPWGQASSRLGAHFFDAPRCRWRVDSECRGGKPPRGARRLGRWSESDGHRQPRLLPQGRRLPVGLPGPYPRSRIHPADRRGPLRRRVPGQLEVERVPRHSRSHLRPPVRARLPPRPRGGRRVQGAGRDLPPEARRGRPEGGHPSAPPEARRAEERQARRLRRRRPRLAHGGARPRAARLRSRGVRRRQSRGRDDPQPDPEVPPPRGG
jgi:hypothetical protein